MYSGERTHPHPQVIYILILNTAPHLVVLFEFHILEMFAFMKNNLIEKILLHKKNLVLLVSLPIFPFLVSFFLFLSLCFFLSSTFAFKQRRKFLLWILEWWSIFFAFLFFIFAEPKKKRIHTSWIKVQTNAAIQYASPFLKNKIYIFDFYFLFVKR